MAQSATTDTVRCTKCDLVHERAPDWHCPRCGSEVDLVGGPDLRSWDPFPTGSRIAGGVSLAAGLVGLLAAGSGRGSAYVPLVAAALVSLGLGVGLLARVRWTRAVALVLAIFGMGFAVIAAAWSSGDGHLYVVPGLECLGLFLLLRGDPPRSPGDGGNLFGGVAHGLRRARAAMDEDQRTAAPGSCRGKETAVNILFA